LGRVYFIDHYDLLGRVPGMHSISRSVSARRKFPKFL